MDELRNLLQTEECLRMALSMGFQEKAQEDYLDAIDAALCAVVFRRHELTVQEKQRKDRNLFSELKEGIDELKKQRLKKDLDIHGDLK